MSSGTCGGCKRMTNSATSDWWLTSDLTPTKCFVAWENGVAVQGCAFFGLTPGAQFLYQKIIDEWNTNSKKTVEEHMRDMIGGQEEEV